MAGIRMRRSRLRLLAVTALAVGALQVPTAASAAPAELLPDLRMAVPTDLTLDNQDGRYWLRFSAMIENRGEGPLEVRSTRRCRTCPYMRVSQAVLRTNGTWTVRTTTARQRYDNSDGHKHWHVMGMERYEIFALDAPFANGPLTGHKRGFCFFDGYLRDKTLPRFDPRRPYSFFNCGNPGSQVLVVGLSVGWGDLYPWDFAGQYVDLAGVPEGDYLLCATADPTNWFQESRNGNNAAWVKVHIPKPSPVDQGRSKITALASGQSSCKSQLPYAIPGTSGGR